MKEQSSIYLLVLEKFNILFNSEKQLLNYLMVVKNKSQTLALLTLLDVLITQSISRLDALKFVLHNLDIHKQGVTSEAVNGLIKENLLLISRTTESRIKEFAIINFLQHVNRYKITAYHWLQIHMADFPTLCQASGNIQEVLSEEKNISTQITEVENHLLSSKYSQEVYEFLF